MGKVLVFTCPQSRRTVLVRGAGLVARCGEALHWNHSSGPALRSQGGACWNANDAPLATGCLCDAHISWSSCRQWRTPQGDPHTQLTCLLVLAATLTGLHVQQPFCFGYEFVQQLGRSSESFICPFALLPLPVLGLGPPSPWTTKRLSVTNGTATPTGPLAWQRSPRDQRSSRAPRSSRRGDAMDTDPGTVSHSSFPSALADTDDDMGEVPADTVVRGHAGPGGLCLLYGAPLLATVLFVGRSVEGWRIASTLCAQQRTNRCVVHSPTCGLRVTALESLKSGIRGGILCRSPWGSGPESVSELQHLCASLQDSGLSAW